VRELVDGVHPTLPEGIAVSLEALLLQYIDVFSQSEADL
jgi:hypothetical protein